MRALRLLGPSGLFVLVAMLGVGFAPLFAGPGYESALAAGLLVPSAAAASAAWRASTTTSSRLAAVGDGVARGAALAALAWATTLAHGLRASFCSIGGGTLLFALGPLAGALLAGASGAALGVASRGTKRPARTATALALALPALSIAIGFARFFTSPMVFGFDPFVGYFSGALYDTVVDGVDRLATYRLGTLATLVALAAFAAHRDRARIGWPLAIAALAGCASLVHVALGSRLGHFQTTASIRAELGGEAVGVRCEVVHARTLREEDVRLFVRDCDADVEAVAAWMGVTPPTRVTAFLFADAAQKRRLMGAADVYIAKPWRREVYVQAAGYPHPVLAHELAHVLAGTFARGPFRVAGQLGGLLPDPGLIEGIAVAAAPDDDELGPEAWSRAMLDLGILPPIRSVFSLGFLSHDASRAYTVAGAFVAFVRAKSGSDAVRRWYGGASLEEVTGSSVDALDEAFRAHVRALPIPPAAIALARARFDRKGVFARHCPHEIDGDRQRAFGLLAAGDLRGALALLRDVAARDPTDAAARLGVATCEERSGADPRPTLDGIVADGRLSRTAQDRAEERLADRALLHGDVDAARARYDAIAARVLDEDHLRTLDVKRVATLDRLARPAIVALLVGGERTGPDALAATEELARWSERAPIDGLPLYLLARSALGRGDHARAIAALDRALSPERELPLRRVRREAARLRTIEACVLGDAAAVARGLREWETNEPLAGNRDALLRALAARCVAR